MKAKLTFNQGSLQSLTYFEPVIWKELGIKAQGLRINSSIHLI